MATLASDLLREFWLFLCNRWEEFNETSEQQKLNVLYEICVFQDDGKTKMITLASDWLIHFWCHLCNHWIEFKKIDRKQDLHVLYQVCVLRTDQKTDQKTKMVALASDWLRYFRLLLCNHWMEFNETWPEAKS